VEKNRGKKYQEDPVLVEIGQQLAKELPGLYGKVTFNFWNGMYVCYNISYGPKPRKFPHKKPENNSFVKKP
jgi:hypothetical protein